MVFCNLQTSVSKRTPPLNGQLFSFPKMSAYSRHTVFERMTMITPVEILIYQDEPTAILCSCF